MMTRLIIPKVRALSARLNRPVASRYGRLLPFWYVIEYPKSGGTWLAQMLSDYLGCPFPQHSLLPITHRAVLHAHWGYTKNLNHVFYLVRDGRDVMVSLYWMRMRSVKRSCFASDLAHKKRYEKLFGNKFDAEDIKKNLPKFIEYEMESPRECKINWPSHVGQWHDVSRDGVYCLKYEDLLQDCRSTLKIGLEKFGIEVDPWLLDRAVERYDFERLTGRKRGQVDSTSFLILLC